MSRLVVYLYNLLILCVIANGYTQDYDWAESDSPTQGVIRNGSRTSGTAERVAALQQVLAVQSPAIHAYIIPTADAHNSPRIAATDARRLWVSGFTAGAGVAVVTATRALMWTDGRYFTQFEVEVDDSVWTLMRQGTDATIEQWLTTNLPPNAVVGIDPTTYTRPAWSALQAALAEANMSIQPTWNNLVDVARTNLNDPPPARPNHPLEPFPLRFTGKRADEKILDLVAQINDRGASALVLSALDDIAWTLNLRGQDIPLTPVFFSYLVIRPNVNLNAILFWGDGALTTAVITHLASEGVVPDVRPYSEIFSYLENMAAQLPAGSRIWLSNEGSEALHLAAVGGVGSTLDITTVSTVTPVALMKCFKNEVELQGFRESHVKDGTAVVRFLRWLHEQVDAGVELTESDAADELLKLREEEEYFQGQSFLTIAGAGENGAIIHYRPSRDSDETVIKKDDMFLVDSGGQYWGATTDITRTRHMNYTPSDWQRMTFTRAMKGHINLATAIFPRGVTGHVLDILARKYLYDVGLDYAHGTGHGVGHYLNVHEGPSGISSGVRAGDPGVHPGMIFSNEPGYYEVGGFGIRHEDLVEVIPITSEADHVFADRVVGDFAGRGALGFYTISLAPHQTSCLDLDLMTDDELTYLNYYHARVLATLGPILRERGLDSDYEFLERECAPLSREGNSARRHSLQPALLALGVLALSIQKWF